MPGWQRLGQARTFLGVAAFLRQRNPSILCVAVEPEGCQPLAGLPVTKPRHLVQGTSYGSVPPHWDASLMNVAVAITDGEVERWRRLLATREGLHVGFSAAANVGCLCGPAGVPTTSGRRSRRDCALRHRPEVLTRKAAS